MGDRVSKKFWSGALWVYSADIENGAGGGGNIFITLTPGAGNELELLYGMLSNQDTAGRAGEMELRDADDNLLAHLFEEGATITNGNEVSIPGIDEITASDNAALPNRIFLAGDMDFLMNLVSVAASENVVFGLCCRIRGGLPTVVESGNSTPTITINMEQVE